jgi:gluconolactonase
MMRHALVLTLIMAGGAMALAEQAVMDEQEFRRVINADAAVKQLASGMKFTEGPVWFPDDGGYLIFSDIPSNELKRWSDRDGLSTLRAPSHNANGNTRDREGRLITCEHSARRVTRTESDGIVHVLVDRFEGKRFNSPNDAVVKADGTIWFTDPPYGTPKDEPRELDKQLVFRFDPVTGDIRVVADDFDRPNGLCFSPDEKRLYIADSSKRRHIRVFDVNDDSTLSNGKLFAVIYQGVPDGIRCDADGRVYSSAGDGVQVFNPDGKLIGKILVPESPANLAFGGADGQDLFITARTSLYVVRLNVRGDNVPSTSE